MAPEGTVTYLYDAKRFVAISPDLEERNGIRAEKRPARAKAKRQKKRGLPLQGTGRVKVRGRDALRERDSIWNIGIAG